MPLFNIRDITVKKRDGKSLTKDEIRYFIDCVSKNKVEDCQLGKYGRRIQQSTVSM